MIYIIEQLQILLYVPVIYCIPNKTQKGNRKYFTKEISYLSYISSDPFSLTKPNIIVARHTWKKTFFFQSVHLFRKHSFPKQRYFLCLICVINAIFFVHITYLNFTRKKMRKVSFHSSKSPFMTCLIKTFIEQIK